jgi:hypothetical protein
LRLEENVNSLRRGDDVFAPRPVTGKAGVRASLSAVVPLTVIKTRVENNELVVITTLKSNETRKYVFESAQTKITKSGNILKLPIAMLFRQLERAARPVRPRGFGLSPPGHGFRRRARGWPGR